MAIKMKGKTLLFVAGAGIILTAYLAARNTPEAIKRKEDALHEKRERLNDPNAQLTFIESLKAQFGAYIPAIISGTVTIGSLVGSDIINQQNLNKAKKSFNDFKDMTKKLEGEGAVKTIENAVEQKKLDDKAKKPWETNEHFRIVFQGHSILFESTRANVMEAIYEINRYFHLTGYITFNEMLKYFGQDPVEEGDDRGYEQYIGESIYGYSWIDIGLKECVDEPWITEIYMAAYPHRFDETECEDELENGVIKYSKGAS